MPSHEQIAYYRARAADPGLADAHFNLGSALALVQTLPHGVYIAMNGKCFHWDNVRKNKNTGEFDEITSQG